MQPWTIIFKLGQPYSTSVAKVKSLKLIDFEMRYGRTDAWTDAQTDERTDAQTGGLLELLSQLKVEW